MKRHTPVTAVSVDVKEHIEAFCIAFIRKEFRDRWMFWLRDRPDKGRAELHKFHSHHDPRYCRIANPADVTAERLRTQHRSETVLVFTPRMHAPQILPIGDALPSNEQYPEDVIISLTAGVSAVVFSHDGLCWVCQRSKRS